MASQQARVLAPDATTRGLKTAALSRAPGGPLLAPGDEVASPETRISYRVIRLLGQGGYGQVYLVKRLSRSLVVPSVLCLKVSLHIDGWLREAYFGQLLADHPRAIRVFDRFPVVRPAGPVLYCLALEYARHGDLSAFLQRAVKGWPETVARREIAGLLQVLGKLHRGQVLHRDLTPVNVFVCDGRRLKLGDFGIVRHQTNRRGITAHTLNRSMVPSEMLDGLPPKWRARDDVYQVGQLLAMLIKGNAQARVRTKEVRRLPCTDELKEIIFRCIGERRKRYESADDSDRRAEPTARPLEPRQAAHAEGRPPRLHRHPEQDARGGCASRAPRRRDHPRRSVGQDDGRRARETESLTGRRP